MCTFYSIYQIPSTSCHVSQFMAFEGQLNNDDKNIIKGSTNKYQLFWGAAVIERQFASIMKNNAVET